MKKIIKEICSREGKKSQTSIANVRETLAVLMDVLAQDLVMSETSELTKEFNNALSKRVEKLENKKAKK